MLLLVNSVIYMEIIITINLSEKLKYNNFYYSSGSLINLMFQQNSKITVIDLKFSNNHYYTHEFNLLSTTES